MTVALFLCLLHSAEQNENFKKIDPFKQNMVKNYSEYIQMWGVIVLIFYLTFVMLKLPRFSSPSVLVGYVEPTNSHEITSKI